MTSSLAPFRCQAPLPKATTTNSTRMFSLALGAGSDFQASRLVLWVGVGKGDTAINLGTLFSSLTVTVLAPPPPAPLTGLPVFSFYFKKTSVCIPGYKLASPVGVDLDVDSGSERAVDLTR